MSRREEVDPLGISVGIISRLPHTHFQWLMDLLRWGPFQMIVRDVKYLTITEHSRDEWVHEAGRCSVGILYHSNRHRRTNITHVDGALYEKELRLLSTCLGPARVVVMLDDVDLTNDVEKQRILRDQPSIRTLARDLLLIPKTGKEEAIIQELREFCAGFKGGSNLNQFQTLLEQVNVLIPERTRQLNSQPSASTTRTSKETSPSSQKHRISIFSRCCESHYQWLADRLLGTEFEDVVGNVRAVYISNNYSEFLKELLHCTLAILYHTLHWGRINVTDVTDSLYDRELKALSQRLGKGNVIVVIDHLMDVSPAEKDRILQNQPSIARFAKELFIFHETKASKPENLEGLRESLQDKERMQNDDFMATENPDQVSMMDVEINPSQTLKGRKDYTDHAAAEAKSKRERSGESEAEPADKCKDLIEFTQRLIAGHREECSLFMEKSLETQRQLESVLRQLREIDAATQQHNQAMQQGYATHPIQREDSAIQEQNDTIQRQGCAIN